MSMLTAIIVAEAIRATPLAGAAPWQSRLVESPFLGRVTPRASDSPNKEHRPLAVPPLRGAMPEERRSIMVGAAARATQKVSAVMEPETIGESTSLRSSGAHALDFCPGDDRAKCNYDSDHRICAQFLDTEGKPLNWGNRAAFLEHFTPDIQDSSSDSQWNAGASKCINMTLTARIVQEVGCENVHIRCDATDMAYLTARNWWVYGTQGLSLAPAVNCLQRTCSLEAQQGMSPTLTDGYMGDWETEGFSDRGFSESPAEALADRNAEALQVAYKKCEDVTKTFSKTFFIGTGLMRPEARKHAWAIYAWCRRTDDIVDSPRAQLNPSALDSDLEEWNRRLDGIWNQRPRDMFDLAMADTVRAYPTLDIVPFRDMIDGMIMDVPGHPKGKTRYMTFDELYVYCYRVAGTVGVMMLPILGTAEGVTAKEATGPALALGIALQLTNILRDVGEDLKRGRIYLPLDELRQFGLTEDDLFACEVTEKYKQFMKFQIARARAYYEEAVHGIPLLAPDARFAVRASMDLYGRILDKIEENDYDNFNKRAYTTGWEKLGILPGSWLNSLQNQASFTQAAVGLSSYPEEASAGSASIVCIAVAGFMGTLAAAVVAVRRRRPSISIEPMLG